MEHDVEHSGTGESRRLQRIDKAQDGVTIPTPPLWQLGLDSMVLLSPIPGSCVNETS